MADSAAIHQIATTISQATTFGAIFGPLPKDDPITAKKRLRAKFAELVNMVHPDHAAARDQATAREAFEKLNELRRDAEAAILDGAYDKPIKQNRKAAALDKDYFEIQSATSTYRLSNTLFRHGDFSVLYKGLNVTEPNTHVLAKIAAEPAANTWLEREAVVLKRFRDAKPKSGMAGVGLFVPKLLDTFLIEGEKSTRYRVNVSRVVPDLVSVTQIIEAFPRGLDPRDAAWVYRRIIAQAMAAEVAGMVHGALVPDHVLVDPIKHEPFHIGWAHAIDKPWESGARITHVIDRWRDFYPPEVFDKKAPSFQTDIYMAGKTMIKLVGGDVKRNTLPATVPSAVAKTILAAVEKSPARRPKDGNTYFDEFTRVVRAEWGKGYRPLMMPVH